MGEEEAEIFGEEVVWVDRAVTKEEEASGEFRRESSSIYLSTSSKNSSIPSWYIAMTKDPSTSRYTSQTRHERRVCWGEGERLVDMRWSLEFLR